MRHPPGERECENGRVFIERRQGPQEGITAKDIESALRAWLASLQTRTPYPRWYLYDAPCSLSRLGKRGDDFEGELVGQNLNDLRIVLLVRDAGGSVRIEVAAGTSQAALATFDTVAALQEYLACDGRLRP